MQLDTFRIQQKKEEAERALAIFCPRCTRRHPQNECQLHSVEVCFVCEENHFTNQCPTLPELKAMYQGMEASTEPLYFLNQRRLHGPRPYQQGMQGTSQAYYSPNQSAPMPSWGPPLTLPGLHLLHGLTPLNTILNPLLNCSTPMASHSLSGTHLNRGGGPSTPLLLPFCLHHQLSHNHYFLLLQDNPKCLLNWTRTLTTDRPSRYIPGKQHVLPMLWRSRRSTYDLEWLFRIANLLP